MAYIPIVIIIVIQFSCGLSPIKRRWPDSQRSKQYNGEISFGLSQINGSGRIYKVFEIYVLHKNVM